MAEAVVRPYSFVQDDFDAAIRSAARACDPESPLNLESVGAWVVRELRRTGHPWAWAMTAALLSGLRPAGGGGFASWVLSGYLPRPVVTAYQFLAAGGLPVRTGVFWTHGTAAGAMFDSMVSAYGKYVDVFDRLPDEQRCCLLVGWREQ